MSTVTARIIGGLGNQMFQYAAGFALASRTGAELLLDVSGYAAYGTWPYMLDRLRVPQNMAKAPARMPTGTSPAARVLRRITRGGVVTRRLYREPHFHVDEAFFSLQPPITIEGYFQSPRYFAGVEDELHRRFQLSEPLGGRATHYEVEIGAVECPVSLHVRGGDYLLGAAAGTYASLGEDYYRSATELIRQQVAPATPTFFVFSDDEDRARSVLGFLEQARVLRGDPERPHDDMYLMSRCRNHIIANSTFGWWGAWLDRSLGSAVVAPSVWFSGHKRDETDTSDLYPPEWTVI